MIKSYFQFLLESVLYTSPELKTVIDSIAKGGDPIAKDFIQLIDNDIETPYNALNITDKNDTISFIPDNQFQNKIKSIDLKTLLADNKNKTSVGRLVQKILHDNEKNYSPNQVTEFTDKFKAAWNQFTTKEEVKEPIRIVEGEELRYWYLDETYNQKTKSGTGTLGKSCMRYGICQDYFDIYVDNKDICKMIIITDEEDGEEVLIARALVWKTTDSWYLDRIYYTDASEKFTISDFAKKHFSYVYSYDFAPPVPKLTIQLSNKKRNYDYYPYMDSFPYYYSADGILYNWEPKVAEKKYLFEIQNTNGSATPLNLVHCPLDDKFYHEDEVIYSAYHDCNIPTDKSVYSYYYKSEIYEPKSNYSKTLDDYIPEDDAQEVTIDLNDRIDYFPKEHKDIVSEWETGEWYLKELLVKIDGRYYLEQNIRKIWQVSEKSKQDYIRIFNMDSDTKLKSCICSTAIKDFWNLEVEGESEVMPYWEYVKQVYKLVIVEVLKKKIESKKSQTDKDTYDEVLFELDDARYKLNISGSPFQHLNWANSIGGEEKFYPLLINILQTKKIDTVLKEAFDSATFNTDIQIPNEKKLFTVVEKVITNHLKEYCEGTTGLRTDHPRFDSSMMPNVANAIKSQSLNMVPINVLIIIKSTLLRSIRIAYVENLFGRPGYSRGDESESFAYFLANPNKFDKLKYNP